VTCWPYANPPHPQPLRPARLPTRPRCLGTNSPHPATGLCHRYDRTQPSHASARHRPQGLPDRQRQLLGLPPTAMGAPGHGPLCLVLPYLHPLRSSTTIHPRSVRGMPTPLGRTAGPGPLSALRAPTYPRRRHPALPGLYRSRHRTTGMLCALQTPEQWAKSLCKRCYEHSPHTVMTRAAGWAERMPAPPASAAPDAPVDHEPDQPTPGPRATAETVPDAATGR
jgi:hypothetical protein